MANWISDFVAKLAFHLETPDSMLQAVGLFTAGAALAGRVVVYSPEELTTNLYLVLSGPPGKVKKTTAIKQGLKVLRHVLPEHEFTDQNASVESLMKSISSVAVPAGIRHGVLFYDEFSGLMHQARREYSSGILTMLLERWQSGAIAYKASRRKDSGVDRDVVPPDFVFSLISSTTPDGLVDSMGSKEVSNGFASRILLVEERDRQRKYPDSKRVPEEWIAEMSSRLMAARDEAYPAKTEFGISEQAKVRIEELYDEFDTIAAKHLNEEFHKVVGRMDGYVKKLALLHAALVHPGEPAIWIEDVDAVVPIVKKSMGSWERVLDDVAAGTSNFSRLVAKVRAILRRIGKATNSDLAKATHARPNDLAEALDTLVMQGAVEVDKTEGLRVYYWKDTEKAAP